MGNIGSSSANGRRRSNSSRSHPPPPVAVRPQPEIVPNWSIYPVSTPQISQSPNSNRSPYFQYPALNLHMRQIFILL
ncbi:hypothetical protein QN277_014304 [Acacia crassicarpa]|uniref:Uncharacterized protein n=1 Tax=Acacia crassicarpa TaxID=499986 RepID=A0AAE1JJU1_9FABA|nr:hypothetical protein QN277_014304 [Acacia crassicarpa]